MPLTDAETRELEIRRELQKRESRTPEEAAQWEERYRRQEARAGDTRTLGKRAREAAWDIAPAHEKVGRGFAKPFQEMYIGSKALTGGGLGEDDIRKLQQLEEVKGGYGTTGEVVGNLAMLATPGGIATRVGTKAATALPLAMARRELAKQGARIATGEVALGAATEFVREPGDLGERAKAGTRGAAITAALPAAGSVLGKTMQGLKRSKAAQQLLDEGVPLTPGMTGGKGREVSENLMAGTPGIAGKVNKQRAAALEGWNKSMLREVAPPGTKVTEAGTDGIAQVQKGFSDNYGRIWNSIGDVTPEASSGFKSSSQLARTKLIPREARRVTNMLDDWDAQLAFARQEPRMGSRLDTLDHEIRGAIQKAKSPQERQILEYAHKSFRNALPEGVDSALVKLNDTYGNYKVIERAASQARAARNVGVFTPNELSNAVRQEASRYRIASGTARMQQQADLAQETIGKAVPAEHPGGTLGQRVGVPAVAAAAYVDPLITGTALGAGQLAVSNPMRNLMTGGRAMDRQGVLARMLRQGGPYAIAGKKVFEDEDIPERPAPIYNPARR